MKSPKIVVTYDMHFTPEQKVRLESLGDVIYYKPIPKSADEYLERVKGADIICSGSTGLQDAYPQLKDVYITIGFVSAAFLDLDVLTQNNVKMSNAPGINRHAVTEWITFMMLQIQRKLNSFISTDVKYRKDGGLPPISEGLTGKNLTILGNGNISGQLKRVAEAYDMNVTVFKRGDNLIESVKNADIVVDTMSSNRSSNAMLNKDFFTALKKGASFISASSTENFDVDALLHALNDGRLNKAAIDLGEMLSGDTDDPKYVKFCKHPKVYATPHIAYTSKMSIKLGMDIMIDNVEAWIKGKPQNLLN